MDTSWLKQGSEPLFPDIEWSKPQTKHQAGKLLVVGGHLGGFSAVAQAHALAEQAGAGKVEVLLPDRLRSRLKDQPLTDITFVRSTPSGSLSSAALKEIQAFAHSADGMLWPGDLGRNSDSTVLLEQFVQATDTVTLISGDAAVQLASTAADNWDREEIILVVNLGQLQHLAARMPLSKPLLSNLGTVAVVDWLQELTSSHPVTIVLERTPDLFVAQSGRVSTTKTEQEPNMAAVAATAAVYAIQHPSKRFEALTTAMHEVTKI